MSTNTYEHENDGVLTRAMLLHVSGEFDPGSIQSITFQHHHLSNIESLDECKNMERANLSFNKITFLSCLKELKSLTFLNLSSNQITNIDPLSSLEILEELNIAGNLIGNTDRLRCLTNIQTLKKLRLQDKSQNLTNPVCGREGYHENTLLTLSQLYVLDGERVKGRGSELYRICRDLDKQLETQAHGNLCPCGTCRDEIDAGRTFGPVIEKRPPEPWLMPKYIKTTTEKSEVSKATHDFNHVLSDCKQLNNSVTSKLNNLRNNN